MLIKFQHPLFAYQPMALSNDEIRKAAERLDHAEKTR